ncbi:YceI family protein [Roseivirga sp.]|uniref:YceI family protein n=1 Tax=Roseivirga sp. TaxID=1964215 RepID=UPI002B269A7F|nr:YceI family protein [Roseivirga sp.]
MKVNTTIKFTIRLMLVTLMALSYNVLSAQEQYSLIKADQHFVVKGTSSLHDWHMETTDGQGECVLTQTNGVMNVQKAEVKFKAEGLESGKGGMDKNAYKALKTDDFPWIEFKLSTFEAKQDGKGLVMGDLTIAGFTKQVTFDVETVQGTGTITVSGTTAFKLTDFKVDPPTALFGTIKTGDDVTAEFKLTFKNQK